MKLLGNLPVSCLLFLALLSSTALFANESEEKNEARFLSQVRQLIYDGNRSGAGYFSENGKALKFQSARDKDSPFFQIYLLDLESGDNYFVSTGIGKTTCTFFRSGIQQVQFASTHLDPESESKQQEEIEFWAAGIKQNYSRDYEKHRDIFLYDRHESNLKCLTDESGYDAEGSYNPDGKRLCWTTNRTSDNRSQPFIGNWNHDAALAATAAASVRNTNHSNSTNNSRTKMSNEANHTTAETPEKSGLSPQISSADHKLHVGYLASDELEGRKTGTKGTKLAADYITQQFKQAGLQPFGDNGTYLQAFDFTAGMKLIKNINHLELTSEEGVKKYEVDKDFRPLAFTKDGEVEGEVVFAGYGLSVPGEMGTGYDSYAGLDVKNKIVLVLRFVPEEVEMERRQQLNDYAGLRYKAMRAREQGAKAILIVSGPNSHRAGELVPLTFDNSVSNSGIIAASVSGELVAALFAKSGKTLQEVQSALDLENPHAEGGFNLKGVKIKLSAAADRIKKTDNNVVALLSPVVEAIDTEYIVIGAHYDHIGFGEIGSLARKGEEGTIHNGADDNASGASTVLELAASLAELQKKEPENFKKSIIFALWSGEELGIIGSSYFVENAPVPLEKMTAYFNFDMVGRLRENKLILQGLGSSSVWKKLIEKRNVAAGFNLTLQDDPYMLTDVTAFYPQEIPVISFFTDSHEDHNRPTDDAETLDYDGMERITKFAQTLILDLAKSDEQLDYVKVERAKTTSGNRETMRAYLGTIPDYVGEGDDGVKLSGVRGGGPADKAGLQGGDIIIEFGGQNITNIYDYTFALDGVKIGKPVKVVVVRDGQQLTFTVIPEARK